MVVMEPDLEASVATTQSLVTSLISTPRVSPQLLAKPPVKFIRDVFIEIAIVTGCGKGLFSSEEVEHVSASRESKFRFLTVLIHFVAHAAEDPGLIAQVRVGKIAAGLEPEKTNLLLQRLHLVATSEQCAGRWQQAAEAARKAWDVSSSIVAGAQAETSSPRSPKQAAPAEAPQPGPVPVAPVGPRPSAPASGHRRTSGPRQAPKEEASAKHGAEAKAAAEVPVPAPGAALDPEVPTPEGAAVEPERGHSADRQPAPEETPEEAAAAAEKSLIIAGAAQSSEKVPTSGVAPAPAEVRKSSVSTSSPSSGTAGRADSKQRPVQEKAGGRSSMTQHEIDENAFLAQSYQQNWEKLFLAEGLDGLEDGRMSRLAAQAAKVQISIAHFTEVAKEEGFVQSKKESELLRLVLHYTCPHVQSLPKVFQSGTYHSESSDHGAPRNSVAQEGHQGALAAQKRDSTGLQGAGAVPSARDAKESRVDSKEDVATTSNPQASAQRHRDGHESTVAPGSNPEHHSVVMSKREYVCSNVGAKITRRTSVCHAGLRGHSDNLPSDLHPSLRHSLSHGRGDDGTARRDSARSEDLEEDRKRLWDLLNGGKEGHELIEAVKRFLKEAPHFNLEAPLNDLQVTPLLFAVACGPPGLVKVFVDAKADVRGAYEGLQQWKEIQTGMTALDFCIMKRKEALSSESEAEEANIQHWEAIEEILKSEIDHMRGWGKAARRHTISAHSHSLEGLQHMAPSHMPNTISEAEVEEDTKESPGDGTQSFSAGTSSFSPRRSTRASLFQRRSTFGASSDVEMTKSLYHSAAGFLCEHVECHPSEMYTIEDKVGEGSFGTVRRALCHKTGRESAIKTLPKMLLEDLNLWSEIAIMRLIDHPHIMRLYATFEDSHNVYMVCELCSGGQLFDAIIEEGCITERSSARLMKQMMAAVCYLHQRHICHRDLKPENFMLTRKGHVEEAHIKLIDFGTAKRFDLEEMTTKVCTVHYVAPDLLKNQPVPYTEKCDVWSCGVILFTMLSGSPPFSGQTDMDVLKKVKKGKFDFKPVAIWENVSQDARQMVKRMLTVKAKDRYSAEEAAHDEWVQKLAPNAPVGAGAAAGADKVLGQMRAFHACNKLKKVALQVIAQQLTDESVEALRQSFLELDTGMKGALSTEQMEAIIKNLDCDEGTRLELIYMMHEMTGGTGEINYTQFLAANIDKQLYMKEEACRGAFALFDVDGDGLITRPDLEVVFGQNEDDEDDEDEAGRSEPKASHTMDFLVNQGEIERIMKECDENGNGEIDFPEFMAMMGQMNERRRSQDEDATELSKQIRKAGKYGLIISGNVFGDDLGADEAGTSSQFPSRSPSRNAAAPSDSPEPRLSEDPTSPASGGPKPPERRSSGGQKAARPAPALHGILHGAGATSASSRTTSPLPAGAPGTGDQVHHASVSLEETAPPQQPMKSTKEEEGGAGHQSQPLRKSVTRESFSSKDKEAKRQVKMTKSATVIFGTRGTDNRKSVTTRGSVQRLSMPVIDGDGLVVSGAQPYEDLPGPNPLWSILKESKVDRRKLKELLEGDGAPYVNCWLDKDAGIPPALFLAVTHRSPELVSLLITYGADVRRKYEGETPWKQVHQGQTPFDVNEGQKGRYLGTVIYDRCEAIATLFKAEEDKLRGWKSGRRISAAARRYFSEEQANGQSGEGRQNLLTVGESLSENEEKALTEGNRNGITEEEENEEIALSKKMLYSAEAIVASQHTSGDPRETYEVLETLGEGTFGVVSRATDKTTGLAIALKAVPKSLLEESDLWQEIELLRDMDFPYITRLHGTYEDSDKVYMILEHCEGGELFDAIERESGLPETSACGAFRQMLVGIRYLHQRGICHRDLKPENFLLSRDGSIEEACIKLIDFGTARRFGPDQVMTTKICTVHYGAPEILSRSSASYTEKCDIWSLGVCLFIMVSGELPFVADTDAQVLKRVRKGKFKFEPEEFWDTISDSVKSLISSLLVLDVNVRPSAHDAVKRLDEGTSDPPRSRDEARLHLPSAIPRLLDFQQSSWFRRCSLEIIASLLPESAVADLRNAWFELDVSGTGRIGASELEGISVPPELAKDKANLLECMAKAGRDATPRMDIKYTSFLAAMLDRPGPSDMPACKSAFKLLDLDGDGLIRWADLSLLLQSEHMDRARDVTENEWQLEIDKSVTTAANKMEGKYIDECKVLIEKHDLNCDDALNFDEWITMLRSHKPL